MVTRRKVALGVALLALAVIAVLRGREASERDATDKADEQASGAATAGASASDDPSAVATGSPLSLDGDWLAGINSGPPVRIAGRVLDVLSSQPVPDVDVLFRGRFGEASASSGPDGEYEIELPVGRYDVRALGERVVGAELSPLVVWRAAEGVRLDVPVARLARVSGVVVDADGRPVTPAEVSWRLPGRGYQRYVKSGELQVTVDTDARGEFTVDVISGDVYLDASSGSLRGHAYLPSVFPGAARDDVRIALEAGARISGLVRDPRGQAVEGARVHATTRRRYSPARDSQDTTTDASGRFAFESIMSGKVTFEAQAEPFAPSEPLVLELAPGTERKDLTLALKDPLILAGHVVDSNGAAVSDARVSIRRRTSKMGWRQATSDATGAFSFSSADRGEYVVVVNRPGYARYREGHVQAPTEQLEITLRAQGSIRGVVTDGSGRAVESFEVAIERFVPFDSSAPQTGAARARFVDSAGRFELSELGPGRYDIRATADGYAPARRRGIEVPPGGYGDGSIELGAGASVVGSVADAVTGEPVEGARVAVSGVGALRSGVFTEASGRFTLDGVSSSRHSLTVAHPAYVTLTQRVDPSPEAPVELLLTPRDRRDRREQQVVGIGVAVAERDGAVQLIRVFRGGSAAAAGVRSFDRLLAIDGEPVGGVSDADAAERLRGQAGTTVTIEVERKGERLKFAIVRARFTYPLLLNGLGA